MRYWHLFVVFQCLFMVLTNRMLTDLKTDIQEIHDTSPNITERLKSALSSEEIIFDSSILERYFNI